jgi:hypothetical protein
MPRLRWCSQPLLVFFTNNCREQLNSQRTLRYLCALRGKEVKE